MSVCLLYVTHIVEFPEAATGNSQSARETLLQGDGTAPADPSQLSYRILSKPTGVVEVLAFPTRFDRALEAIRLSSQPVTLRAVDY